MKVKLPMASKGIHPDAGPGLMTVFASRLNWKSATKVSVNVRSEARTRPGKDKSAADTDQRSITHEEDSWLEHGRWWFSAHNDNPRPMIIIIWYFYAHLKDQKASGTFERAGRGQPRFCVMNFGPVPSPSPRASQVNPANPAKRLQAACGFLSRALTDSSPSCCFQGRKIAHPNDETGKL